MFYANIRFARRVGESPYNAICYGSTERFRGELVFRDAAYGRGRCSPSPSVVPDDLAEAIAIASNWVSEACREILALEPDIVGCSTTFEQSAASVALIRAVKAESPGTITLLGGANCEGEMGPGLSDLVPEVDYTFSGECDEVFPAFLASLASGRPPAARVIKGTPCADLDALPAPDYTDYYEQLEMLGDFDVVRKRALWLPYEASRGCWWGEKRRCTFCGVNGETLHFRKKSPERVLSDLDVLLARHPSCNVAMVDNIMPREYFTTLLPALARSRLGAHIFYEQKANLRLDEIRCLRDAGVGLIQPGIEALSTPLLRLIDKGVSGAQNVRLLRYCRSCGVSVNWNLLYGFPNDRLEWYVDTLALIPLLRHLHPPTGLFPFALERFSRYHDAPEEFGITEVSPVDAYAEVFPPLADLDRIAYHFTGTFESESRSESGVIASLRREVDIWRKAWQSGANVSLSVTRLDDSSYVLIDSRNPADPRVDFLNEREARLVLVGPESARDGAVDRAAARGWIARLDGEWVGLATADVDLIRFFESAPAPPAVVAAPATVRPESSV